MTRPKLLGGRHAAVPEAVVRSARFRHGHGERDGAGEGRSGRGCWRLAWNGDLSWGASAIDARATTAAQGRAVRVHGGRLTEARTLVGYGLRAAQGRCGTDCGRDDARSTVS